MRADLARRIKSKLLHFNLMNANDNKSLCEKYLDSIEAMDLPQELQFVFASFASLWRELSRKIAAFDEELEEQAQADKNLETVYRSVPGVGKVSSRLLANELGDLKQFSNVTKLYSYTGLTPSEFSSGEKVRKGHINRQGPARIRKALIECAWRALEKDPALKADFERIAVRAGKKRAIIGVARRLIGRIRACFISGKLYELGYEPMKA